ncbi:MAG: hypothetical protein KDE51_22560, partial [Anaerolineales bacterium]|nr:hypothetical protein [Anaerolineales bacterium]
DNSCPSQVVIVGNPAYYENLSGDNSQLGGFVIEDNETVIDGYTQCSSDPNNASINGNADIRIQIEGNGTTGAAQGYHGLVVKSDNNEVRGLSIVNWGRGIELREAAYNIIAGNFIGLNTDEQVRGNFIGLYINFGSTYNIIGGINLADRNIVSGNVSDGIKLNGLGVTENQVIGNYVGLKQNGSTVAGNGLDGIDVESQSHHNWVGGILLTNDELFPAVQPSRSVTNALLDSEGNAQVDIRKRNIVAGNGHNGIEISQKLATKENRIVGNWVGMDAYGNQAGNGLIGITIEDRANHNLIYLNVVVGSNAHGVRFYTVYENELFQNWIGLRPEGAERRDGVMLSEEPMPNGVTGYNKEGTQYYGRSGIEIMGGSNGNMIYENVIAHNKEHGIHLKALAGYLSDP